jgi:hypothetical protein
LFSLLLQVVGLASTLLKLLGLTCLLTDSLKKTLENELQLQKLLNVFFLSLQVVGLASTLLKLVRLICLIADILKKTL